MKENVKESHVSFTMDSVKYDKFCEIVERSGMKKKKVLENLIGDWIETQ